jgi:hypothetical protein
MGPETSTGGSVGELNDASASISVSVAGGSARTATSAAVSTGIGRANVFGKNGRAGSFRIAENTGSNARFRTRNSGQLHEAHGIA